jgi:hydroxymethylbilane synthase
VLGHAEDHTRALLRAGVSAAVADDAAARALGREAVAVLRAQGAAAYLPA